jgi:hypothetical protein
LTAINAVGDHYICMQVQFALCSSTMFLCTDTTTDSTLVIMACDDTFVMSGQAIDTFPIFRIS